MRRSQLFVAFVIAITTAVLLSPLSPAAPAAPADPAPSPGGTPGSTQSLPLRPLRTGEPGKPGKPGRTDEPGTPGAPRAPDGDDIGPVGLTASNVKPFSLVGVVWRDPRAKLDGRVQVRTRARDSGRWSDWQDLQTHSDAPAPDSDESTGAERGGTAPLWVGESDGIKIRVLPRKSAGKAGPALPEGLTAELLTPGASPDDQSADGAEAAPAEGGALDAAARPASAANTDLAPLGATEIQPLSKAASEAEAARLPPELPGAKPFIGPRPRIVTRRGWGANERLRERKFKYTKTVNIAFVHHSASGNNYRCAQAPEMLRSIYRYHVKSQGWADLGYNFAIDKCGRVYEGRAGGVAKAVMGAHTYGFNHNSVGIAVLGSYDTHEPPKAAVNAIARLTAWKLGLFGRNPKATQVKISHGGMYRKGKRVRLRVISGHRDGYATECPGLRLYGKLGTTRTSSARYQGRP